MSKLLHALSPATLQILCTAVLLQAALGETFPYPTGVDDFLSNHCFDCHDDVSEKGGLNLLDLPLTAADPKAFRKWVAAYDHAKSGEMPP